MEGARGARSGTAAGGAGREIWVAGAGAGALAGLAMVGWMMAAAALDGGSALDPLRAAGATFRGPGALNGGAGTVAWGLLLHLAVGALLGVLFAALVPRDISLSSGTVLGAGSALVTMAFAMTLVVPRLAPVLAAEMPRNGGSWVIAHTLFGAVIGIAPWLRRRIGDRSVRRPEATHAGVLRPRTSG